MKLGAFLFGALTLVPCLASAAPDPGPKDIDAPPELVPPAVVARDDAGHVTIRAIRLAEPLVLDGRLDDSLYHETDSITDFVQQEPFDGEPATDKTEVWGSMPRSWRRRTSTSRLAAMTTRS